MIRAILFDMGGTLDSDGLHWLDRFVALYRRFGVTLPRDTLRAAFDAAEALAATDDAICTSDLDRMVAMHVGWQLAYLGDPERVGLHVDGDPESVALQQALIDGFVKPIRSVTSRNRALLADLAGRGFILGVVSNGCGNVDVLCRDYGFAPFLKTIVDSRRLGVSKPDPRIFAHAVSLVATRPAETLFVGDSFERDIVPAKQAGMKTAWLQPDPSYPTPDPAVVDVRLSALADLAAWLPAPARIA